MKKFFKALILFIGFMLMFTAAILFYNVGVVLFGTHFVVGATIICLGGLFYNIYSGMN